MVFRIKLIVVKFFGKLGGSIFGFLCGLKLGRHGYSYDTAAYIFNQKLNKNIENEDRIFFEFISNNKSKGTHLFRMIWSGFKANYKTYRDVVNEIKEYEKD